MTRLAHVELIEEALSRGDADGALAVIESLEDRWRGHAVVRRWRARALLAQERSEEAMEEARLALGQDPSSVAAHVLHAQAAWQLGRLTPAQNSFERAMGLSRNDPAIRSEYALFMAGNRTPSVAEPVVQEALRVSPQSAEAWSALGLLRLRENRLPEATAALERAFELDPRNRRGMAWMAMLLQRSGKSAEADALSRLLTAEGGGGEAVARERRVIRSVFERETLPAELFERPGRVASHRWAWVVTAGALIVLAAVVYALTR